MRRILVAYVFVCLLSLGNICACPNPDNRDRMEAQKKLNAAMELDKNGEYEKALRLLNEAEKIETVGVMTAVNLQIAKTSVCVKLGRYHEAYNAYDRALALAPDKPKADQIKLMAGELYFMTGRYEEGYQMLQTIDTDSLLFRRDIQVARMLQGLQRGKEAISLLDSLLKKNNDKVLNNAIVQNIGYIYWDIGLLEKAELYLRQALQGAYENQLDPDRCNVILENHALVLSELGYDDKAIEEIEDAVKYHREKRMSSAVLLRKAAEIYARVGDYKTAVSYFKRFFQVERRTLVENLPQMTQQQRANLWWREKQCLAKCFLLEKQDPEFLFEVAMFRRQTALLGQKDSVILNELLMATPRLLRNSLMENEAAIEFITYKDFCGETWYAAVILSKYADAQFVRLFNMEQIYKPEVVGNNSLYNAIKREDKFEIDLLYGNQGLGDLVWGPIITNLPKGVNKIYFSPEGIFHIWGIENMPYKGFENYDLRRVSSTASLINKEKIRQREISRSRLVVGGLDYDRSPQMERGMRGSANHESRNILHKQLGKDKRIFKYLNGTKVETDSIANLYKVNVHHEMGESELKHIMNDHSIVHIATHGYSLNLDILPISGVRIDSLQYDRSLLSCGLALSGANICDDEACEDNILSAREIFDMDLSNVDFVILSACQTAKGDIIDEGAVGLVRGLKNAGVKTILASLWSVDDYSTMLFMKAFHAQLICGKTPNDALRAAQNSLKMGGYIKVGRKFSPASLACKTISTRKYVSYQDPYYWAPFILIDAIN